MNNIIKLEYNVLYLGKNSIFAKELNRHLYSYKDHIKFNYKIDSDGAEITKILEFNPRYIIADFSEGASQYEIIFQQLKQLMYPNNLYVFGIAGTLSDDVKTQMIKYGCNFIYEQSTSLDEPFFLVKSIVLTIDPKFAEKKELAAAKPNISSTIQLPCFISETNSSHFFIESNFEMPPEEVSHIDSELIQNKLIFSNDNLKVINSDVSFVNPFYTHRTKIKHNLLKASEKEDILNEILNNAKIDLKDKKESLSLLLTSNNNDKKQNYFNWVKKNRVTYDQDINKKNILMISKKNKIFKLKSKINQNFVLYQLRSLAVSNMNLIKRTQPLFIFYELEAPPKKDKYIEDPETEIELFLDNALDFNFIKNLTEVFHTILSMDIKTKVIVFNNTGISDNEIRSNIGIEVLSTLNCSLSEEALNDYLNEFLIIEDVKTKQNKEQIVDKSLYGEREKVKNQSFENSLFFRFTDPISKAWVTTDGVIEVMTENQIRIRSKSELPQNEILKINSFISFNITVIKSMNKDSGLEKTYHCVINGITSKERDLLRAYVINYNEDPKVI